MEFFSEEKRMLLDDWLKTHGSFAIFLAAKSEHFNSSEVLGLLYSVIHGNEDQESIYLLCKSINNSLIPVYIGKSKFPITRWQSHFKSLEKGNGTYQFWGNQLLYENSFLDDIYLFIIPEKEIKKPPIPNFPCTIGSIEYQLISLASDSYPDKLLNREGNRR